MPIEPIRCKFIRDWAGRCIQSPVPGHEYCSQHIFDKCEVCGKQATHSCDQTLGLVCGAPLCDDHKHTDPSRMVHG